MLFKSKDHENIESITDNHSFSQMVDILEINPKVDLRYADLVGCDFSNSDLRGYDFTGANLSNSTGGFINVDETTVLDDADTSNSPLEYWQLIEKYNFVIVQDTKSSGRYKFDQGTYWSRPTAPKVDEQAFRYMQFITKFFNIIAKKHELSFPLELYHLINSPDFHRFLDALNMSGEKRYRSAWTMNIISEICKGNHDLTYQILSFGLRSMEFKQKCYALHVLSSGLSASNKKQVEKIISHWNWNDLPVSYWNKLFDLSKWLGPTMETLKVLNGKFEYSNESFELGVRSLLKIVQHHPKIKNDKIFTAKGQTHEWTKLENHHSRITGALLVKSSEPKFLTQIFKRAQRSHGKFSNYNFCLCIADILICAQIIAETSNLALVLEDSLYEIVSGLPKLPKTTALDKCELEPKIPTSYYKILNMRKI